MTATQRYTLQTAINAAYLAAVILAVLWEESSYSNVAVRYAAKVADGHADISEIILGIDQFQFAPHVFKGLEQNAILFGKMTPSMTTADLFRAVGSSAFSDKLHKFARQYRMNVGEYQHAQQIAVHWLSLTTEQKHQALSYLLAEARRVFPSCDLLRYLTECKNRLRVKSTDPSIVGSAGMHLAAGLAGLISGWRN